eukprot:5546811-Alexandrium_andersonii.AAC.1
MELLMGAQPEELDISLQTVGSPAPLPPMVISDGPALRLPWLGRFLAGFGPPQPELGPSGARDLFARARREGWYGLGAGPSAGPS